MTEEMLEQILGQLAGKILPAPHGRETTSLNHGLHFTGGEPFVNFPLLCRAVDLATQLGIPSTFVETNAYWCLDDRSTREKLDILKGKGLRGILISVNPFYLEYVPFERTLRAARLSLEVFGRNTMVYQVPYFQRFLERGYQESAEGYYSKCHLCMDLRKHLAQTGDYPELSPREFYLRLGSNS